MKGLCKHVLEYLEDEDEGCIRDQVEQIVEPEHSYICLDCGVMYDDANDADLLVCPECGSDDFDRLTVCGNCGSDVMEEDCEEIYCDEIDMSVFVCGDCVKEANELNGR